jgi:hypothetical protein
MIDTDSVEVSEEGIQEVIEEAAQSGYAIGLDIKRNLDGTIYFQITHDSKYEGVSHVEGCDVGIEADQSWVMHDVLTRFLEVSLT